MSDADHALGSHSHDIKHDVRNRLTVIKGVVQMLDRQIRRDDWQRDKIVARLDLLQAEIGRLERLVEPPDLPGIASDRRRGPDLLH